MKVKNGKYVMVNERLSIPGPQGQRSNFLFAQQKEICLV